MSSFSKWIGTREVVHIYYFDVDIMSNLINNISEVLKDCVLEEICEENKVGSVEK